MQAAHALLLLEEDPRIVTSESVTVERLTSPKRSIVRHKFNIAQYAAAAALGLVVAGTGAVGLQWWLGSRFIEATDNAYVESDISMISPQIAGFTCPSPLCGRASFYWEKWPDSFGIRPHNVESAASHSSRALSSRHIGLRRNATEAPVSGVQTCRIHQSGRSCSDGQNISQHDNLHSAFVE